MTFDEPVTALPEESATAEQRLGRLQVWLRGRRADLAFVFGVLAWFAITQRWTSWSSGIRLLGEADVASYAPMAAAAPGLPHIRLGSDFTQRFVVHYCVGLLAKATGLSLPATYRAAWVVVFLAIVVTVVQLLWRLGVVGLGFRVCVAVLVLSPYAFRYYAIVPGMLADPVFELGLALSLLGAVSRRVGVLLAGVVVAIVARQTALLTVPVLAMWLLVDAHWQGLGPRRRWFGAAALAALPGAGYVAIHLATASFSKPYAPRIPQDTVLPLLGRLPGTASELTSHVLHSLAPLVLIVALLAAVALARRRGGWSPALSAGLVGPLAMGCAVLAQTLAISPDFPGLAFNEPRLSALGLIAFVVALAVEFARTPAQMPAGRATEAAIYALLALGSLHDIYSVVGPSSTGQFLIVQLAAGAALVPLILMRLAGHGAGAPGAARTPA